MNYEFGDKWLFLNLIKSYKIFYFCRVAFSNIKFYLNTINL